MQCSTEGNNLGVSLYDASETFDNYGLSTDQEGNLLFLGSFFNNVGFNKSIVKMDAGASFNVVTEIKNENDRLVEINYDRAIAGLFAVIYLVKNESMVIPGNKAQTTINKYNPNFREISPEIYKNIGKISFVKNSKGIITITTNDKEAVQFEQVKVKHNARINIITYKSGNAKIEILSGVKVGKAIVWYDLNSVTLYKNTGNLLFDYGNKHSTSEVNMKNDILD